MNSALRQVVRHAVWLLLLCPLAAAAKPRQHKSAAPPAAAPKFSSQQALARLMAGNRRYVTARLQHPNQTVQRRREVAKGQNPFAAVLSCADSRVPPEVVFDGGLGDLFVVRNAGEVVDDPVTGSIEYAVEHLNVPLVVVMGHQACGAVKAAIAGQPEAHITSIIEAIAPAVAEARSKPGDQVANTVEANVRLAARKLKQSQPVLAEAVGSPSGAHRIIPAKREINLTHTERAFVSLLSLNAYALS